MKNIRHKHRIAIVATHIPIVTNNAHSQIKLYTHIALANPQWKDIEGQEVLVITEPHAYISLRHYVNEESVPTWNYVAVHVYGTVPILRQPDEVMELLDRTAKKTAGRV